MLDALESTVTDPSVNDAQIVEFDQQVADATTALGISDEWLRGSPGRASPVAGGPPSGS
jgi:hypothetical protein